MLGRIGTARGQMGTQYQYSETMTGHYLPLPPPVLQQYTLRLKACLGDPAMTPKVFEAMLHDEEFYRDVNSMYTKEFVELLRAVGCRWLRLHVFEILGHGQDAKGNRLDTDLVEDDGAGAAAAATAGHLSLEANEEEVMEPEREGRQENTMISKEPNVYKELHSILLLLTVMGSPYRMVRDEGCLTMSCNIRLLLCRDPSLVYLGLLINFTQPHLPDKALDGVALMRVIAHGWGASPTFEDVLRCSLQARQRSRQRTGACSQQDVDAAMLQLPNLVKDPLRILHERFLQRTLRGGTSQIDPVPMCRTVLKNMEEAAGNPEKLLWWCRCRLLCSQLLPSSDREEVFSGPLSDFFRSVWRTERLFSTILEEAEFDDNPGGDCEESSCGAVPSAAMLVGTIADVVHAWHFALRGCAAISGLLAIRYVQNPLDSVNCVVPQHRKFQEGSHCCLAEDWQYRLLTEYHSTHLALFTPTSSTGHASALPAMVAQLTDILRLQPHYCPVLLMRSLALTGENTNISIALNHGLVRAVVAVMRTYMDEQQVSDAGYEQQHIRRRTGEERTIVYGWTYEAVRILRCCFVVLERLATVSTHEYINPIVFLLTPNEEDGYELCQDICRRILHRDGHPVLLAAAFRFFSACIHHNVRDVVPALLQRGVLQTILEIGENPTILRRYNERTGGVPLSSAPVGSAGTEPRGATGPQTTSGSSSPDGRICETYAWLVSEEDATQRASVTTGRDANTIIPVDPSAYYEQAIPMLDICSVLQAFAVHNSTHAQLHRPQLMWSLLWSLIVPVSTASPTPSTGVSPLRVNTRAATAAGKDLISLLRTLPDLRDSFFEAFSETLKGLVAASQRQNPPEEIAISMWNIIACISGAEFRQLSHRIQHRRQRNYAPDHNSLIGEMLTQKLVRYKSTLSQAIRVLLQLPHRISVVSANCSVLSLFVCNIPLPILDHISSVILNHVTKIAELVQTSGSAPNGGLSEDQATSLLLLTWAFFCRFHNQSPPAAISKLRCELANALFDTYVALELARGKAVAATTTNSPTGGNEADRNDTELNRAATEGSGIFFAFSRLSTPAAISLPNTSEIDVPADWPWVFGASHLEDSLLLQEERSLPEATSTLFTVGDGGGGGAERGTLSAVDRFRESIAFMLQPSSDRRQQFFSPTRAYRQHGFLSANQQFLLPVSTAHLLTGAEKALKKIVQEMMKAVQGRLDMENETAEGCMGGAGILRTLRVVALDALNISQLKEVEMRMRFAEGPISIVWRNGGNADGGFTALFTGILACLQFITEGVVPLRKLTPSLAAASSPYTAMGAATDNGAFTMTANCEEDENADEDGAVGSRLSSVLSSMTRILELLLRTTPERSSTRRHWVQPLLYFMLAIWRAHGLMFTPAMTLGVLARLFDFSTDILDVSADRSLSAFLSNIAEGDNEEMVQLTSFWPGLLAQEGGTAGDRDDDTVPESFRSPNEEGIDDAAPPASLPASGEQQQQRPCSSPHVSLAECARDWVLDVASTLRFADGVTEDEQKQMRRLCCRVCWIYTTLTPQKELPDRVAMPSGSDRHVILLPIIRRILEDPGRNYTLLELLAVLISQEETEKYFVVLFKRTQLPRAIFDCVTAEVQRLSDESSSDACQLQRQRLRRKAMLGQLFCFLSVSSANTLGEKKMRVCAYYRSSPSNFCWMGHLCRHLHPQNRTPMRRQIKYDMSSSLVASVTSLLRGFGYSDACEEEAPSENKSSKSRPDEVSGNNTNCPKKAELEASVTSEENLNREPTGQAVAVSPASLTSAGSNSTRKAVRDAPKVELRLSDVLGITSILPDDLLLQCAELVLDYLAGEDAELEEQRQEQEQEQETEDDGRGGNGGGGRQNKKLRELNVLETPVTHIAVDFLSKVLGSSETSLVSHLYQLNETTKKGFIVRAISRLLRNDMSGSGPRVPVMKALLDQTEHTEWVVYSAMVSAVQNEIRMGSTYTLQEKDVQELCARHAPHASACRSHHGRGVAEVHRQAIVLSDFFVALRSVIDKHPKAFYTVFNVSCFVFILHIGNRGIGQESVKTTVWLAPRKPPRQNVMGGSRTPHRLAVEKVLEMLIQRLEGRTLVPPLVTSVLNHITTLPSVASIVTSYNVNVRIPGSMQGVFAERKTAEDEQAHQQQQQQQQLTYAPVLREAPLFLTPFLAVILFMEKSQLELLEGFFFNVAQKAPSRLVHVLLHALEVMLEAIPPGKNRFSGEEESTENASLRNPSPSDMACSFLHVLRVLLGAPRSSLVWRLCDELWQRDALELLYRMVEKKCCNNERDAAALLLVIRRVLLAYGKCNSTYGKKSSGSDKKNTESGGRPELEGCSGRSGAMSSLQQQGQPLQPPQAPQEQQPRQSLADSMAAHEASMLLLDEGDVSRTPRTQPSGAVDDAFFLEDLVRGHDQHGRSGELDGIRDGRRLQSHHEGTLTEVMFDIGEMLRPNESVLLYHSNGDSDGDSNHDNDEDTVNTAEDEENDEGDVDIVGEEVDIPGHAPTPISMRVGLQDNMSGEDDDDDDGDDDDDDDDDDGDGDDAGEDDGDNEEEEEEGEEGEEDEEEEDLEELSYVIDHPPFLRATPNDMAGVVSGGIADEFGDDGLTSSQLHGLAEWEYDHYTTTLNRIPIDDDNWTLFSGQGHAAILEIIGRHRRETMEMNYSGVSGGDRHGVLSRIVSLCEAINEAVDLSWDKMLMLEPLPPVLYAADSEPPRVIPPPLPTLFASSEEASGENDAGAVGDRHETPFELPFEAGATSDPTPQEPDGSTQQVAEAAAAPNTTDTTINATVDNNSRVDVANARICALFFGNTEPGRSADPTVPPPSSSSLLSANANAMGEMRNSAPSVAGVGETMSLFGNASSTAETVFPEPPMEQQPWFGEIEPHFLVELPESFRRELLFDHMNLLLCGQEREEGGQRTHIYAAFMNQLPPDMRMEAIEVEHRWRRVTGEDSGTGGAQGGDAPTFLTEVLATVDPEVRRDILLTCDLRYLEGNAALLAEATVLRELQSMEAQGGEEEDDRRLQEGREEGERLSGDGAAEGAMYNELFQVPAEDSHLPWFLQHQFLEEHGGRIVRPTGAEAPPINFRDNNNNNAGGGGGNRRPGRPPRGHNRVTESFLTTRIRALQNRFTREEKVPPPPNRQNGETGAHAPVPPVPIAVLRQLMELICFAKGGFPSLEYGCASSSLSVSSQLVVLLITVCVNTASATEALVNLLTVALDGPLERTVRDPTSDGRPGLDRSRIAVQVVFVIEKLIERCRAAGLSFTMLPDGVEEGGPPKPIDEPYNEAEQQAMDAGLFRRLMEVILRFPSPRAELSFTRILSALNAQLRALEDNTVKVRSPREQSSMPLSNTIILHPRHAHRLQWTSLCQYPCPNGSFLCDCCDTKLFHDTFAFCCSLCHYVLCPQCSLITLTAEEEAQRIRRCAYALVKSNGTLQTAARLLSHSNCTNEMGLQTVQLLRRGIKESARRDTSLVDQHSPIAVVERIIVELAKELTEEIHTRFNAFRSAFLNKTAMGPGAVTLSGVPATTGVDSSGREWTTQEASLALSYLNLRCTTSQSHAFFLPYAETLRPEQREVSLMWHASQIYLAEVASILQRLQNRSSVLLPHAVLLLLNRFCQFHMAEARRGSCSASLVMESHSSTPTVEKTETERFMLDTTHTPSSVSDAAVNALARAGPRQQQQQAQHPQQSLRQTGRLYQQQRSNSEGESAETLDSTRDERPALPRLVRQFVERNKTTINTLIQYDPKLLEENFAFLKTEPGFIDFNIRLLDFQRHISHTTHGSRISLSISRDQCLRDSFAQLSKLKSFHGSLNVRFRGEEGADAGGLTREWFQLLAEEMVNDDYALFIHSREGMTYRPNPFSDVNPNHLQYFKFAGTVVGMAVAHSVPIDVHFTRAVYRHMTGVQPIFRDLESVDPELYDNLNWLLRNDVNDLGLFFTVSCERFGVIQETELVPNGGHVAVTNANKSQYVRLRCEFHMTRQIEQQMEEFLKGFYTVIPRKEIRNFTAQELELVICGMPDIDVEDLRVHTLYDGYTATSPQIRWFWEVVASMTKEDRANLLQFATGASKVPHGGFSNLESASGTTQRFTITRWGDSVDLLPQAHTCFNKIDLPEYPSCEELRRKLMLAITFGSRGFSML
ncbi:ubiquitin-protein ligase-like [Trypanosoma cruzi cruzi]|nr:ubiquitin-protein ligase-like [Trypanosoma cruzi cruzi]